MESMHLTLPVPPSANVYWRYSGNRVYVTPKAKAYKRAVLNLALVQGIREPTDLPCAVHVRWFRKRRAGDLDNRLKIILDALQGVMYHNDSQIIELHAVRDDDKDDPRIEVRVEPIVFLTPVPTTEEQDG